MKKRFSVILAVLLIFALSACGEHASSYRAIGFVHSNESDSAFMSFYQFNGRMVFKLRCTDPDAHIKYSGELESGSITVSYECDGEKSELFSLSDGSEVDSTGGELEKGKVYIYVETDGKCNNGRLDFSLEQ